VRVQPPLREVPQRGTTLVELLVVLALVSIMVVVAAELLGHSIGLLGATGRAVRNPVVVHVNERIRRDIQEAASIQEIETIWSEDPLEIQSRSNSLIRYEVVDGNLVRSTFSPATGEGDARVLLRGVTSWWWRSTAPSVVDINIGHLVHPPPENLASRKVGYERERRIENLRFAMRGGWGGSRW
jgi:prepilin-type N-terminal cleavage/methylation domain-containing protein